MSTPEERFAQMEKAMLRQILRAPPGSATPSTEVRLKVLSVGGGVDTSTTSTIIALIPVLVLAVFRALFIIFVEVLRRKSEKSSDSEGNVGSDGPHKV